MLGRLELNNVKALATDSSIAAKKLAWAILPKLIGEIERLRQLRRAELRVVEIARLFRANASAKHLQDLFNSLDEVDKYE